MTDTTFRPSSPRGHRKLVVILGAVVAVLAIGIAAVLFSMRESRNLVSASNAACAARAAAVFDYLRSGDDGGDPTLFRDFGNEVGASEAQARSSANAEIRRCDLAKSQSAAASVAAASASSAAARSSVAEAKRNSDFEASRQADARAASCYRHGGTVNADASVCSSPYKLTRSGCESAYFMFPYGSTADVLPLPGDPSCWE